MKMRTPPFALWALLTLTAALACDGKNTSSHSLDSSAPGAKTEEDKAAKKKATVDALLRANGIDPSKINATPKSDSPPDPQGAQSPPAKHDGTAVPVTKPSATQAVVELLSRGTAPRKQLRYQFKEGRKRKFTMDMEIQPKRVVNGQPIPGTPAIKISMAGTSVTEALHDSSAQRVNTFLSFTPSAEGAPPMMLAQMNAQFEGLKGIQLVETVNTSGQVLEMHLRQGALNNPQVLALMQNLQDGMSNAFLSLPNEAVGIGAQWKETTTVQASGLDILQENTVHLITLKGNLATVELNFKQSAKRQEIQSPGLPPGAKVELISMEGGGTGKMTVDLSSLVTDSLVTLRMTVDTRITGTGAPEAVNSATDTTMKIHMRVTQ